jgi:hypothetical protein
MFDQNTVILFMIIVIMPAAFFLYYFIARSAVSAAIDEYQGARTFNRWILVIPVLIGLGVYAYMARPFVRESFEPAYQPSTEISIGVFFALLYVAIEIPYQLIKSAAKDIAEGILAAGDDRRNIARLKSAQTLATIISRKLKISCELQAFSSNDEFIFLTYILNNKPAATRLKIIQADNPESWKKLGEWLMSSYQKENPQQ